MKKLSAIAASLMTAVMLCSPFSAKAETELTVTTAGDINLDKIFSISDLVLMEKYLLGAETLSEQAFVNADLNGDGCADVFDLCLFRKELVAKTGGLTAVIADLNADTHLGCNEAFITSLDELYGFFGPLYVLTEDGGCIDVPVIPDEELDKLAEKYDEEFFRHNGLMLKTDFKPYGGEVKFGNIYYSGDSLIAEYYDKYSRDIPRNDDESYQLLQVVVPKALNRAKSFHWVYDYPEAKAEVKTSFTREATSKGWGSAIGGNLDKYFFNKMEFDKWIDGKFHSAVEKSLKETYDEDFFAENSLYIDLYAEGREKWTVSPKAEVTAGKITLTYDRELTDAPVQEGLKITQVIIPKGACQTQKAEVKRTWQEKKSYQYKEFDLGMLCETKNMDMVKAYNMQPKFLSYQEELDEYLREYLTDEAIEILNLQLYGHTAYIWMDSDVIGAKHTLCSAYRSDEDKVIELGMITDEPYGDIGGDFLHMMYVSPDDTDYDVRIRNFYINDDYPTFDESPVELDFWDDNGGRILFIDQYSFENEYAADLYLAYPGGGPMRFRKYEYFGTIELASDYKPFDKDYSYSELEDGSHFIEGKDFRVSYLDGKLTVSCKSTYNGEFEDHVFEIN